MVSGEVGTAYGAKIQTQLLNGGWEAFLRGERWAFSFHI
jgi:hypothetical protein